MKPIGLWAFPRVVLPGPIQVVRSSLESKRNGTEAIVRMFRKGKGLEGAHLFIPVAIVSLTDSRPTSISGRALRGLQDNANSPARKLVMRVLNGLGTVANRISAARQQRGVPSTAGFTGLGSGPLPDAPPKRAHATAVPAPLLGRDHTATALTRPHST